MRKDPGHRPASPLVTVLAVLSLAAFLAARLLAPAPGRDLRGRMLAAAETMDRARLTLLECRRAEGVTFDPRADFNGTGLIGLEYSGLTTSLGNLAAKRTTTNPDFAALVVRLLDEAGLKKGGTVAVGASSSFPALIVAVLSAARVMELRPILICSLGASQFGANDPEFHWLDMLDCLRAAGIFDVDPVAVSIGGDADSGRDMSPATRERLKREILERGLFLLEEDSLEKAVAARLRLYERGAGGEGIKAFVNIGGSWANLGTDPSVLEVKPGLARVETVPAAARRGVLQEMSRRGVPVVHFLYIKGLAERYGLAWDPRPLPRPGEARLYDLPGNRRGAFVFIGAGYFLLTGLAFWIFRRGRGRGRDYS